MSDRIQKAEYPEDPERCQGICADGQCPNKGLLQSDGTRGAYCLIHNGRHSEEAGVKESLRNYQLTKFKARFERHAESANIKNLRDEIGILRMMMEEKINRCADETDLMLQSGPISDMVLKIEKVVGSCHKLEGSMGQLLDKQAILQFAGEMIAIIAEEIKDQAVLDSITNKLMAVLGRLGQDESVRDTDGQ